MRFYHNNSGAVAKLLPGINKTVVMFDYKTMFFNSEFAALEFLRARGFRG